MKNVTQKLKNEYSTVGHKSHDPCFHKKYKEAGVMTFVARCIWPPCSVLSGSVALGSVQFCEKIVLILWEVKLEYPSARALPNVGELLISQSYVATWCSKTCLLLDSEKGESD